MRPLSRRARFLLIALAGAAAMLAGALPVLVSRGRPPTPGVTVEAGSVDATAPDSTTEPHPTDSTARAPSTSYVPPTSPSAPATPGTTAAAPTTGAPAACRGQNLAMNAGTDRVTYRPGDHIVVTATVTNNSAQPCWVTDRGSSSGAASCDPQVQLQLYDATDGYNALLGPYHAPCGSDPTVLAPGDSTTAEVDVPFTAPEDCGPDPGAPACRLRTGSWTVVVNWLTGGSDTTDAAMSAELVFFCPPNACSPASSAQSGPSTTATTAGPPTSTTSTTTPSLTSTTTPAHKSSTTTTTKTATSTTTRRASRRAGG